MTTERLNMPLLEGTVERRVRTEVAAVQRRVAAVAFETVSDLDALEALGPEWKALFEASGVSHQVFQTFEWLATWATNYLDKRTRPCVVTGRIDGRLVLVWPLVVQTVLGFRVLSGMGEPLSQYTDALIANEVDEVSADAALDYVMALPVDVVSLRRVRDDAAAAPLLRRRLGPSANRQASPFVDFAGVSNAEAFENRFPGKLRASRRRRRRRLEERGAVAFLHYKPSPEAAGLVRTALSFKREWAKQTGVFAPALRDLRFEQFFVAAALAGSKAPDLRVSALRCGDDVLGVEISVACKGRLFGHVLAPRSGLSQLGLGGILAEMTVVNALDQGYAAVDLLAPADPYKLEWTTTSVGVGDYCISRSLIGHLYTRLWLRFGREALKSLVHRLRPGLAALLSRLKGRAQS